MARSRDNDHQGDPHRWIDIMSSHWSVNALFFYTALLVVFCFLFYNMQSSPAFLLQHVDYKLGLVKAQGGDSHLFSYSSTTTRSSPSDIAIGAGSQSDNLRTNLLPNKTEKVSLNQEDLLQNKSDFEHPNDPSQTEEESASERAAKAFPEAETVLEEKVVSKEVQLADDQTSSITEIECDWSKGKWVYDESYSNYKLNTCPHVERSFRCLENGRPSSEFEKWRWQPDGCDLPRLDGRDMLERLRGSRMVFVGDSLGRTNMESMLCMLSQAVANKSRVYEVNGAQEINKYSQVLIYRFEDYDCTVEYYFAKFLVPEGLAPPNSDPRVRSTLKLDLMDWSSSKWRTAEIVIFNSGHWWRFQRIGQEGIYFEESQTVHMNMTVEEGYRRAMETVARFVEKDMDPAKSQVFFRSYAPAHWTGGAWDHGGSCIAATKPVQKVPFNWKGKPYGEVTSKVLKTTVKNPVQFLNVTYLTSMRPDGHCSIWKSLPPSPINHQDCTHWCLPGVPDTWSEILYATLLKNGQGKWGNHNKVS